MPSEYLEHANVTVCRIEPAVKFLRTALPGWRVRGQGAMDWFGAPIQWLHLGTDDHYIALQSGGDVPAPHWKSLATGVKHLGIVVPDLDAVVQRLLAAGYRMDHPGGVHAHRRSAYYDPDDLLQIEFVQYLSDLPAERNAYA
jgi:hypothetical protein